MSTQPAVVVNKRSGFFTALVQGIFGVVIVTIICVTALGSIAMFVLNQKTSDLLDLGTAVVDRLDEWPGLVPPVVADFFLDHRDLDYRDAVEIDVRVVRTDDDDEEGVIVLEVHNTGDKVVTWLTGRLVAVSDRGLPLADTSLAVATPFAFVPDDGPRHQRHTDEMLQGPILPGSSRLMRVEDGVPEDVEVRFELTELRTWVKTEHWRTDAPAPAAPPAIAPPAPPEPIETAARG